jgi:hypothetical protein
MSILKSALAAVIAGGAVFAISSTAFATTLSTTATASPTPTATPTATPTPTPTPTPIPAAGALTISLTCDTGPTGSGTFTVTANGKSSTVSVGCGKSATVTNAAWKAGSTAVIHQTAVPSGALKARDVTITLKASAQSVAIRDFRPASTSSAATLAQTGGGVPTLPLGLSFIGLLLIGIAGKVLRDKTVAE